MHFAQTQTHNENRVSITLSRISIEALPLGHFISRLHIKIPFCARIVISKNRLAVFINTQGSGIRRNSLWFTAALNSLAVLVSIQSPVTISSKANSQK